VLYPAIVPIIDTRNCDKLPEGFGEMLPTGDVGIIPSTKFADSKWTVYPVQKGLDSHIASQHARG
jgi:hypothetical protein